MAKNRLSTARERKPVKDGALRVWHIPQVPMKAFYVLVKDLDEAKTVLNVLADYDKFQFENRVKPDYSNASGLEIYIEKENAWEEWEDESEGLDILAVIRREEKS